MTQEQLHAFMSDPDLAALLGMVKVSDDMLDVISLSETQHSQMLAWCLNPGEGHAQGDAVIKDFLLAAHSAATAGSCVHDTKKFFSEWSPGRIQRTSFGAAFITREFQIDQSGLGKKGRLDLLLVDPQNKILVAIENKAGATLTSGQLQFYVDAVNQRLGGKRVFKDFQFAYVVLDRELQEYDEEYLAGLGKRWALLDYSWLKTAAQRARAHVERNNQAAQMLMTYCQSLTDWQKPEQLKTSILAAHLAERHKAVVDELKILRRSSIQSWTPATLDEDLCLFFHQNRHLCDELVRATGIGGMVTSLRTRLGSAAVVEKNGPTRLSFATDAMRMFQDHNQSWWPMYIHIRRRPHDEADTYDLRFIVNHSGFSSEPGPIPVRQCLKEIMPGLAIFPESNHRRIAVKQGLSFGDAVTMAVKHAADVDRRLEASFANLHQRAGRT